MKETLAKANGLGLAAPQVGILRRAVIVVNDDGEMLELVNPEIVDQKGEQDGLEGCLSVPGLWGYVKRPAWVKVKAQDRDGNWFEVEGQELTARCFCHELSHLDGHLYTELTDKLYTCLLYTSGSGPGLPPAADGVRTSLRWSLCWLYPKTHAGDPGVGQRSHWDQARRCGGG